jgi:tryptophanyl-tRNA synthetase
VRWDPKGKPGVSNLLELLAALKGGKPAEIAAGYESYGRLKADAAEAAIETLRPLQDRYRELAQEPASVRAVLAEGAVRASEVASRTLERAQAAIGLLPF